MNKIALSVILASFVSANSTAGGITPPLPAVNFYHNQPYRLVYNNTKGYYALRDGEGWFHKLPISVAESKGFTWDKLSTDIKFQKRIANSYWAQCRGKTTNNGWACF